jgi:phosphate transport system substrate-binding protein
MIARLSFATLLLVSVAVAACRPAPQPQAAPDQSVEAALRISGSGAALPLVDKLAQEYSRQHPSARFAIDAGTNSGGGIQGVVQGTLDLAVANRPLTDAEGQQTLEVRPFARDAVVFAAHPDHPVPGLSTADVRQVYGGSITDWAQIGGSPAPVLVLDRDPDEPQRSLFLLKLLNGQAPEARTTVLTSARDMLQTLEATSDSLGYSTLALLRIRQPKDVRVLALDGVTPGRQSLTAGTYPWYLTYTLINRPDAPRAVSRFLEFVRGPEGQRVLEQYDAAPAA